MALWSTFSSQGQLDQEKEFVDGVMLTQKALRELRRDVSQRLRPRTVRSARFSSMASMTVPQLSLHNSNYSLVIANKPSNGSVGVSKRRSVPQGSGTGTGGGTTMKSSSSASSSKTPDPAPQAYRIQSVATSNPSQYYYNAKTNTTVGHSTIANIIPNNQNPHNPNPNGTTSHSINGSIHPTSLSHNAASMQLISPRSTSGALLVATPKTLELSHSYGIASDQSTGSSLGIGLGRAGTISSMGRDISGGIGGGGGGSQLKLRLNDVSSGTSMMASHRGSSIHETGAISPVPFYMYPSASMMAPNEVNHIKIHFKKPFYIVPKLIDSLTDILRMAGNNLRSFVIDFHYVPNLNDILKSNEIRLHTPKLNSIATPSKHGILHIPPTLKGKGGSHASLNQIDASENDDDDDDDDGDDGLPPSFFGPGGLSATHDKDTEDLKASLDKFYEVLCNDCSPNLERLNLNCHNFPSDLVINIYNSLWNACNNEEFFESLDEEYNNNNNSNSNNNQNNSENNKNNNDSKNNNNNNNKNEKNGLFVTGQGPEFHNNNNNNTNTNTNINSHRDTIDSHPKKPGEYEVYFPKLRELSIYWDTATINNILHRFWKQSNMRNLFPGFGSHSAGTPGFGSPNLYGVNPPGDAHDNDNDNKDEDNKEDNGNDEDDDDDFQPTNNLGAKIDKPTHDHNHNHNHHHVSFGQERVPSFALGNSRGHASSSGSGNNNNGSSNRRGFGQSTVIRYDDEDEEDDDDEFQDLSGKGPFPHVVHGQSVESGGTGSGAGRSRGEMSNTSTGSKSSKSSRIARGARSGIDSECNNEVSIEYLFRGFLRKHSKTLKKIYIEIDTPFKDNVRQRFSNEIIVDKLICILLYNISKECQNLDSFEYHSNMVDIGDDDVSVAGIQARQSLDQELHLEMPFEEIEMIGININKQIINVISNNKRLDSLHCERYVITHYELNEILRALIESNDNKSLEECVVTAHKLSEYRAVQQPATSPNVSVDIGSSNGHDNVNNIGTMLNNPNNVKDLSDSESSDSKQSESKTDELSNKNSNNNNKNNSNSNNGGGDSNDPPEIIYISERMKNSRNLASEICGKTFKRFLEKFNYVNNLKLLYTHNTDLNLSGYNPYQVMDAKLKKNDDNLDINPNQQAWFDMCDACSRHDHLSKIWFPNIMIGFKKKTYVPGITYDGSIARFALKNENTIYNGYIGQSAHSKLFRVPSVPAPHAYGPSMQSTRSIFKGERYIFEELSTMLNQNTVMQEIVITFERYTGKGAGKVEEKKDEDSWEYGTTESFLKNLENELFGIVDAMIENQVLLQKSILSAYKVLAHKLIQKYGIDLKFDIIMTLLEYTFNMNSLTVELRVPDTSAVSGESSDGGMLSLGLGSNIPEGGEGDSSDENDGDEEASSEEHDDNDENDDDDDEDGQPPQPLGVRQSIKIDEIQSPYGNDNDNGNRTRSPVTQVSHLLLNSPDLGMSLNHTSDGSDDTLITGTSLASPDPSVGSVASQSGQSTHSLASVTPVSTTSVGANNSGTTVGTNIAIAQSSAPYALADAAIEMTGGSNRQNGSNNNNNNANNNNANNKNAYTTYTGYPIQTNSAPNQAASPTTGQMTLTVMSGAMTKNYQRNKNKNNSNNNNNSNSKSYQNQHNQHNQHNPNYSKSSGKDSSNRTWTLAHERTMDSLMDEVANDAQEIFGKSSKNTKSISDAFSSRTSSNNSTQTPTPTKGHTPSQKSPGTQNNMPRMRSTNKMLSVGSTTSVDVDDSVTEFSKCGLSDHDNDNYESEDNRDNNSNGNKHSQIPPLNTQGSMNTAPNMYNLRSTSTGTDTGVMTDRNEAGKMLMQSSVGRNSRMDHLRSSGGNTSSNYCSTPQVFDYHKWQSIEQLNHNIQSYINVQLDRMRKHKVLRRPGGESRTFITAVVDTNSNNFNIQTDHDYDNNTNNNDIGNVLLSKQTSVSMTPKELAKLTTDAKKRELMAKDLMKKYPTLERKLIFRIEPLPLE